MRVYFIQRKSDGMYLRAMEGHYSAHTGQDKTAWSEKPAYMLRTIDGVKRNIEKLCSTPRKGEHFLSSIEWTNYTPEKAELYNVVVSDISILKSETFSAEEFLSEGIDR